MPYVITESCQNDGACVEVCPVGCIHTTPDAPQHYIDPEICIECEQCVVVCPFEAIFIDYELPDEWKPSAEVNARFFRKNKTALGPVPLETAWHMVHLAQEYAADAGVSVAVAVVDAAGAPIAVGRMDGAQARSVELALNKAFTAMNFHVPTQDLVADGRQPWFRSLVVGNHGHIMAAGGGIPIAEGPAVRGAIGVAGGSRDEQDVLCARAGMAALAGSSH